MEMIFSGTLARVFNTQTFKSGSKKREFWATETIPSFKKGGKSFENKMSFEIFASNNSQRDETARLDSIPVGSIIKFSFSPRGNEWQGHDKVFDSLRVTSEITVVRNGPSTHQAGQPKADAQPDADSDADAMPF